MSKEESRLRTENAEELRKLRAKFEDELQDASEDMEKKHSYQLETKRQELEDKYDKVRKLH